MVKKSFEKPIFEVISFDAEDIIRTSGGCPKNCAVICMFDNKSTPECDSVTYNVPFN